MATNFDEQKVKSFIEQYKTKINHALKSGDEKYVSFLRKTLKDNLEKIKYPWQQNPHAVELIVEGTNRKQKKTIKEANYDKAKVTEFLNHAQKLINHEMKSGGNNEKVSKFRLKVKSDLENVGYPWQTDPVAVEIIQESKKNKKTKSTKSVNENKIKALTKLLEKYSGKKVTLKEDEGYWNSNYNENNVMPFKVGDVIAFSDQSGDAVKGIVLNIDNKHEDGPTVSIQDLNRGSVNDYSADMASTAKVIKRVDESKLKGKKK